MLAVQCLTGVVARLSASAFIVRSVLSVARSYRDVEEVV